VIDNAGAIRATLDKVSVPSKPPPTVATVSGGGCLTPARLLLSPSGSNSLESALACLGDEIDYGVRPGNVDRVTRPNLGDG
jgi:hypothetical protein